MSFPNIKLVSTRPTKKGSTNVLRVPPFLKKRKKATQWVAFLVDAFLLFNLGLRSWMTATSDFGPVGNPWDDDKEFLLQDVSFWLKIIPSKLRDSLSVGCVMHSLLPAFLIWSRWVETDSWHDHSIGFCSSYKSTWFEYVTIWSDQWVFKCHFCFPRESCFFSCVLNIVKLVLCRLGVYVFIVSQHRDSDMQDIWTHDLKKVVFGSCFFFLEKPFTDSIGLKGSKCQEINSHLAHSIVILILKCVVSCFWLIWSFCCIFAC